jgi:hypothetical protein
MLGLFSGTDAIDDIRLAFCMVEILSDFLSIVLILELLNLPVDRVGLLGSEINNNKHGNTSFYIYLGMLARPAGAKCMVSPSF